MRFWDYQRRGLTVIWRDDDEGVSGIVVSRAGAGPIDGVKIGDAAIVIGERWGPPARVRGEGRFLDHFGAGWVLSAEVSEGQVVHLTLMRASTAGP